MCVRSTSREHRKSTGGSHHSGPAEDLHADSSMAQFVLRRWRLYLGSATALPDSTADASAAVAESIYIFRGL